MSTAISYCQNCGRELELNESPCSSCGSKSVNIEVPTAKMVMSAGTPRVKTRQREKGYRRFKLQTEDGHFESDDRDKYPDGVYMIRVIDKEKDEYLEIVIDEKTEEIIRCVHEPLSQHR